MLKSGGENGTSFLNSRKVKSVHSAFYFWKMASKFQEMGGVLVFFPQNSNSVGRKLFSFPCNFFFVRRNFYFLGRFFDYKPLFLHESAQFSSERREIPKKQADFLRKHQEVAKFKSAENRLFPTNFFWSCKWRVKLGGQNGQSFLSTDGLPLILFSTSVSID